MRWDPHLAVGRFPARFSRVPCGFPSIMRRFCGVDGFLDVLR